MTTVIELLLCRHYKNCSNELLEVTSEEDSLETSSENRHRGCTGADISIHAAAQPCLF